MAVEAEQKTLRCQGRRDVMPFRTSNQVLCNMWSYHSADTMLSTE